jgi:hypothetical protein
MLQLPGTDGHSVPVFADVLSRRLAQVLPLDADYQLAQKSPIDLELSVQIAPDLIANVQGGLVDCLRGLGVDVAALRWQLHTTLPPMNPTQKRRKIVCHASAFAVTSHDSSTHL